MPSKNRIIPENYGVVLFPGFFPGGQEVFSPIISRLGLQTSQIFDGTYNDKKYYEGECFLYDEYIEDIVTQIGSFRSKFDKIILIGVSFGGKVAMDISQKTQTDGLAAISPVFTLDGIHDKWTRYIKLLQSSDDFSDKKILLERAFRLTGLTEVGFSLHDLENVFPYISARARSIGDIFGEHTGYTFDSPTMVYYSEGETGFLQPVGTGEQGRFEEFSKWLIEFSHRGGSLGQQRLRHGAFHVDTNPNYRPIRESKGNFQVVTNMSHPSQYGRHGELLGNSNPYMYMLQHLVWAIEGGIDLSQDKSFEARNVAWAHAFGVVRGMVRNRYQRILWSQEGEDRELRYMVESLLRIDTKDKITLREIFTSFGVEGVKALYYW